MPVCMSAFAAESLKRHGWFHLNHWFKGKSL